MTQVYSNPAREELEHALPDVEVFYLADSELGEFNKGILEDEQYESGWYWWSCFPGCLPDGDAMGPFDSETEATKNAQKDAWQFEIE